MAEVLEEGIIPPPRADGVVSTVGVPASNGPDGAVVVDALRGRPDRVVDGPAAAMLNYAAL